MKRHNKSAHYLLIFLIILAGHATVWTEEIKGTPNAHQSLLAPEEELITLLFGSINNRQNHQAVKLLSRNLNPNKDTEKLWIDQFNAIRSVHIQEIKEISKDAWTHTKKMYRVTLEIYVDNSAANASIPYYGWGDNPNIRFITVVKINNRWFVDQIGTRL